MLKIFSIFLLDFNFRHHHAFEIEIGVVECDVRVCTHVKSCDVRVCDVKVCTHVKTRQSMWRQMHTHVLCDVRCDARVCAHVKSRKSMWRQGVYIRNIIWRHTLQRLSRSRMHDDDKNWSRAKKFENLFNIYTLQHAIVRTHQLVSVGDLCSNLHFWKWGENVRFEPIWDPKFWNLTYVNSYG